MKTNSFNPKKSRTELDPSLNNFTSEIKHDFCFCASVVHVRPCTVFLQPEGLFTLQAKSGTDPLKDLVVRNP